MSGQVMRYAPGEGTVVTAPQAVALVSADSAHPLTAAVERASAGPLALTDIARTLLGVGVPDLTDFAWAVMVDENLHLLLRGAVLAEVTTEDGGVRSISGTAVSTWSEEVVPAPQAVRLSLGSGQGAEAQTELTTTSATASQVSWTLKGDAASEPAPQQNFSPAEPEAQTPVWPPPPPAPGSELDEEFGELLGATRNWAVSAAPPTSTPPAPSTIDTSQTASGPTEAEAAPHTQTFDTRHPIAEPTPPSAQPQPQPTPPAPGAPPPPAPPPPAPMTAPPTPPASAPPASPPPTPAAAPPAGLIASVPAWSGDEAPPAAAEQPATPPQPSVPQVTAIQSQQPSPPLPPATPAPPPPQQPPTAPVLPPPEPQQAPPAPTSVPLPPPQPAEDPATVARPSGALLAPSPQGPPVPVVQAVMCSSGHPNPPHGDPCRTCRAPITDRTISTIARPVLGQFRFTTGLTVPIDGPMILGRKPSANHIIDDTHAKPVQLEDAEQALSRSHIEVRIADWQVQITDRDSMNGTFVVVPGRAPFRLHPGEPYPIPPGTQVNLGDVVSFTYEPTQEQT